MMQTPTSNSKDNKYSFNLLRDNTPTLSYMNEHGMKRAKCCIEALKPNCMGGGLFILENTMKIGKAKVLNNRLE